MKYYQCTKCGTIISLHKKLKSADEDDIYVDLYCDRCENERALYLGEDLNDLYYMYDVVLDQRYYNYEKTKKQ